MEVTSAEKPKPAPPPPEKKERDFLHHVESFLSRRDGVDKLLKIARYAAKIVLSTSSSLPENQTLTLTLIPRLKSFESSVGLSRKAFRLGKFVQDVNSLRSAVDSSRQKSDLLLAVVAYGSEGLYYFVEQLVWLSKTGLIPAEKSKLFAKISAWAELVGYIGSISIKVRELDRIRLELESRKDGDEDLRRKLKEKMAMKWLSVVQDLADGLMALGDVRDGKGAMTGPTLMASAGMLSALISAHKNWNSC